jgi:hypothetical protein
MSNGIEISCFSLNTSAIIVVLVQIHSIYNLVLQPNESFSNNFRSSNPEKPEDSDECYIIDFHSAQFLSPATDLAHLLLTRSSTFQPELRMVDIDSNK